VIIGVERVLDIDAVGQMVASVLSKKIAAGATHLVIDIPVGPTAKVRGAAAADTLERALSSVAQAFGLRTRA
jgi:thymidine phosphorylase